VAVIVPMVGDINLLKRLLASPTYTLYLYKNDYTPIETSLITDFTVADFPGFSAAPIMSWVTPVDDGNHRAISHADPIVFTQTGTSTVNQIYGYFVVDYLGVLCWAERFATAPIPMIATGSVLTVIPYFTGRSEF
jgi:hypothetical protein